MIDNLVIKDRIPSRNSTCKSNRGVGHHDIEMRCWLFIIALVWVVSIRRLDQIARKSLNEFIDRVAKKVLKVVRAGSKLLLFLLAFTFLQLYGLEIKSVSTDAWYYSAVGWCLIIMCYPMSLLAAATLLKGRSETKGKASSIDNDSLVGWLVVVDVIAVGIIFFVVTLVPAHQFKRQPLRYIENGIDGLIHRITSATIAGVTNNADEAVEFNVRPGELFVNVLAVGEASKRDAMELRPNEDEWVDYGWIEDADKKVILWEMRRVKEIEEVHLNKDDEARDVYKVKARLKLAPGRYILRYRSDGTYSVNLCKEKEDAPDEGAMPTVLSAKIVGSTPDSSKEKNQPADSPALSLRQGTEQKSRVPARAYCMKIKVTVEKRL